MDTVEIPASLPARASAAAATGHDAALARMGSDVCIYSLELAIDEIAGGEVATDPRESAAVRELLRTRAGLSTA